MIHKFFQTQLKTRKPKDWISTVMTDLKDLKIEKSIVEIKQLKKTTLKRIINNAIETRAFERLVKLKETHSKLNNLEYNQFKMQNYFKASRIKITQEEIQTIFKLRSRMIDVKVNFKGKYENLEG